VSRLPLRVRLTLAFALAMAAVLVAIGWLLYARLGDSLLEQVDEGLEGQAPAIEELVRASGDDLERAQLTVEDGVVQVLWPGERIVSFPPLPAAISEADVRRAVSGPPYFSSRDRLPGLDEPMRLLVTATPSVSGPAVVVVGASLEDREEALDGLLAQLLVVGPLALLLACAAGYVLAGAALRPVEAMRRRAAEVSSDAPGRRLPLPQARDEVQRLGETLNDMLGRLEAGLARERRFVADASHELRTPLALLQTELELASRRPRSRKELEQALGSAREEVERLVRLAEDLLVLARADDGRLPLAQEKHIVREVLDAVAGRYDSRAAAAGRAIHVAAPDDSILTGDRLRLEQALRNLVDNALRHGSGAIRLEARQIGGLLELRVGDDGKGFPPEFLPHAFERFSRADVAREGAGAGLGLAIVDAIARAHGGSVAATNKPNGGALVVVRIPVAAAHLALI
jgi:two-component system, OmpR family, sensor kinase